MRITFVFSATLLTLGGFAAYAAEPYEGIWAYSQTECRDLDGANSRTFIDLTNREKGKRSPLFDQYEHHCRIDRVEKTGTTARLTMRCFEFWDFYRAGRPMTRQVSTLAPIDRNNLKIDGKAYVRCAK
ncbi:MAG: hypothetical protein U1E28_07545 [Beijerinckiaceae bacterium]